MADDAELERRARDLLAAYRTHAGPSPAAVRRLHADLRRSAAAEGLALTGSAAAPQRVAGPSRRRGLAVACLLAAALLAALRLAPERMSEEPGSHEGNAAAHAAGGAPEALAPVPHRAPEALPTHVSSDSIAGAADRPVGQPSSPVDATPGPRRSGGASVAPARPAGARGPAGDRLPVDPPAPAVPAAPTTDPPPGGDALARELAFIREVNRELSAGAPERALALLAVYPARFPDGLLREEAEALRAVATCTAEPARAPEVAAAFLRTYPASLSAARVRRACGDSKP